MIHKDNDIKKRLLKTILMLAVLLSAGIVYYFVPDQMKLKCIFYEVTGLYCPGCGITRVCMNLLKLDFYQAFRSNCVAFINMPIFVTFFGIRIYSYIKTGVPLYNTPMKVMAYFMIATFLVFGVLRNIPALTFLRP